MINGETDIPSTMRAVVLTGHGGIDKLVYREGYPTPTPLAGDVLIKVAACGVNNTDINTRTAWYSAEVKDGITCSGGKGGFANYNQPDATWGGKSLAFPRIQGADVAGRIIAVGEGIEATRIGQRVITDGWLRDATDPLNPSKAIYFGSERDGGYAEYTTIPAENAHSVECDLSDVELATFNVAYATGENLLTKTRLTQGETVLITGASGGVGSAMIQLAKCRGARVVALTSSAKMKALQAIGADVCIERDAPDLRTALLQAGEPATVDVVADVVGGTLFPRIIEVLRRGGRYGTSGAIAGPEVALNLRHLIYRDLEFFGATFLGPEIFANIVRYIEQGMIKPLVAKTFPLQELGTAQAEFIEKNHTGNFVIVLDM